MVDIHAHILAGLDDGAQTTEEALAMVSEAARQGIYHIVASSHGNLYAYTIAEYRLALERLRQLISDRGLLVKLYSGMEILLDDTVCRRLAAGELLTINDTDYVLVEPDFDESGKNVIRQLHALQKAGYHPVLAHPERFRFIQNDPELAFFLAEQGILMQVNIGSTAGWFGTHCRRTAELLMREGLTSMLGTDMHDTDGRAPRVDMPVRYLRGQYGERQTWMWLSENPSRILKGKPVIGRNTGRNQT